MRCIVTGGSGFIGAGLLEGLVRSGHFTGITSLDRVPLPRAIPGVNSVQMNIQHASSLQPLLEGIDVVFHLAAAANVDVTNGSPLGTIDDNIRGTTSLLEASRLAGVKRFIFASTVWVYSGVNGSLLNEDTPLFPCSSMNLYASTKIAAEILCRTYEQEFGMPCTILRFETPYGPHMRPELVVYKFLRQAIDGKPITIAGQGQQTRCFIHINDLVEGIIQAAITPSAAGKTYNLPGPRPISIRELAELVTELVPNSPEIIFVPGRQNESRGQAISRSRAENELGWQPRVDVRDGVRELYAWLNSTTNGSGKAFRQSI